jgi:hypothetical protein
MVIDNLRNVEIVLASGECVQANETENPDLFWAIRGPSISFLAKTNEQAAGAISES